MRVLVTGGRKYADRARVYSALDAVHAKHGVTLLIEGGALGADRLARDWAKLRRVPYQTCDADWDRYGKVAGLLRNSTMLADWRPQAVVAFKGNTGTADMVEKARQASVPVWEVPERRAPIFVFGSNLAGRHGLGTALTARRDHGAIYGQGEGLQGNSYAIPTKDGRDRADLTDPRQTLPLQVIAEHVERFKRFAAKHPELRFLVTPIGCGHAGYKPAEIGPLFAGVTKNVDLPPAFVPFALAEPPPDCN